MLTDNEIIEAARRMTTTKPRPSWEDLKPKMSEVDFETVFFVKVFPEKTRVWLRRRRECSLVDGYWVPKDGSDYQDWMRLPMR